MTSTRSISDARSSLSEIFTKASAMRNACGSKAIDLVANEVRLVQDAEIWTAKLDGDVEAINALEPGRKAWLQVARGEVTVCGQTLKAGDAAAITDQEKIAVRSLTAAEVLLFDLA